MIHSFEKELSLVPKLYQGQKEKKDGSISYKQQQNNVKGKHNFIILWKIDTNCKLVHLIQGKEPNKVYMRKRMLKKIHNLEEVHVGSSMGCQEVHVDVIFSSESHSQTFKNNSIFCIFLGSVSHTNVYTCTQQHSMIWYLLPTIFSYLLPTPAEPFFYQVPFQILSLYFPIWDF